MTTQIKQRIEQIRRGEVPDGYKKTKVGVVPNEWEESRLSKYLVVNNDKNTNLQYGKEDVFSISGEVGIVNQIELLGRSYAGASVAPYGIVYPNNIVYTKSPLKANPYGIIKTNKTGKTGIVSTLYAIFHCKDNVLPDFVQAYFELDQNLNNYLYPIVNIGAKHDMKISDENSLVGYVVFPSLAEQQKIAKILSAQDRLIALKEKLIEEKKRQKKALMQQLLTGKKRLPGFCGEWTASKIKDVTEISAGATPDTNNPEFWGGNIKWMNSGELNNKHIYDVIGRITETGLNKTSTKLLPQKCVLIGLAGQGKTRGTVAINYIELCTNQSIAAVHPCDVWIPEFLYYSLDMRYDELRMISSGDGTRGGLNLKLIGDLIVKYPSYEEQEAIANVLSTADKEIAFLQKDLDQEKQKKKALMQLLLTGIVRTK